MGAIYTGTVMRLDPGGPVIRVPLLGRDALWGPVVTTVGGLLAGEKVAVGQLGSSRDQLIILGRLDPTAGGVTGSRLDVLEGLLTEDRTRITSAESRIAALTRSDHTTGADVGRLHGRLEAIEYAASALPAALAAAGDNGAAVTALQADVATLQADVAALQAASASLRSDLTAAQGVISTTQSGLSTAQGNISGLTTRVADLEAWRASGGGGSSGGGTTTQVGKTTAGSSSSASTADKTAVSLFTAGASGVLTAGHAHVWVTGGSASVKCVVYANSSNVPGAKLAESDVLTVTGTEDAVRDFVFSGANKINMTDGTSYFIGAAWADPGTDSVTLGRDGTTAARQEASAYAPSPFGTATAATGPVAVWVDIVG